MIFPDDHPLKRFEKYYYLESGTRNIHVYIFRFTQNEGVIVWFVSDDKDAGPHGSVNKVTFSDDYNFDLTGKPKDIKGKTFDEVLKEIALCVEVIQNGTVSRENCKV